MDAPTLPPLTRKQFPRLSVAERDRRWANVRARMAEAGIDCLLVHGDSGRWDQKFVNMRYLSHLGGNGEDGWFVFPLSGDPVAFLFSGGSMQDCHREMQDWVTDIRHAAGRAWSQSIADCLHERGLTAGRIGVVGLTTVYDGPEGTVPHGTMVQLTALLPRAAFVDAADLVESLQLYRSDEEIAFIEEATRIGDYAIEVMRRSCRAGCNEYVAYARTFAALIEAGSQQPLTFFWDSGKTVNHAQRFAGWRLLEDGDMVVTEISPRYFGYWSHFQAMVGIGTISDEYRDLLEIVLNAYHNALSVLRPGIALRDLWEAFDRVIRDADAYSMHVHAHGTGGRGSDYPILFPPYRLTAMKPERRAAYERMLDIEVRKGMVLAFEPHATRDGVHGVHVGDPVVVTDNGCRRLSRLDLRDWMVPVA